MNKTLKNMALLSMFLVAPQVLGAAITNGDFGSSGACNLSDWDQFGNVSTGDTSGNCSAELNVNDDPNYEAELWQALSFDANTNYTLSVNFSLDSTLTDAIFDDYFSISLINLDYDILELFSANITGAQSFDESLAITTDDLANFTNQDWSLSFYLYDEGGAFDDNTSFASINNVFLEEVVTDVPEPSSLAIFALGFVGLMSRRKIANELIRKAIKK